MRTNGVGRLGAVLALLAAGAIAGAGCPSGTDPGADADDAVDSETDGGGDADADAEAETDVPPDPDLVRWVDPFIGTDDSDSPHPVPGGAGGSTYPGAVVPFGGVQLGPDTPTASPSGYRYSDTRIEQFSMTHFDGAGCPNNEDLPFLPVVGALDQPPGTNWSTYRTGYDKSSETASPGFYGVFLERHGIGVELTATERTGFVRLTYPPTAEAHVLLHAGRSATGFREGSLEIVAPDRIRGTLIAGGFCWSGTSFAIHFVVVFDRPFSGSGTWQAGDMFPDSTEVAGVGAGAWATFDTTADPVVRMKIGLSYVSVAGAEANLAAENPGWDFDAVREAAADRWNEVLGRVRVSGGSDDDRTRLYTALYRVLQNPNVASDVSGDYMGFDGVVHRADRATYQNFSGWDIIRSWTHLVAAIAPEAPDIIASMVQDGVEAGLLPFWSHQSVETHVMVGDPGTVNVANAHAMGVRGFDADAALALMVESADDRTHTRRWALGDWLDRHFTSNAAVDLEYAMADFALAQFAGALGDTAANERYLERSGWWTEGWNPDDGYVEPRVTVPEAGEAVGDWDCRPFDPAAECGFIEGNAAQYVWLVPHDLAGLFARMGGHAAAIARLDDLFTELNAGTNRPYFYIGNEPEHGTPWVYHFAGAPGKTREVLRRIVAEEFGTTPGGLPGNDDLGATSAWLVWAYLGLYPAIPGTDILALHGPMAFDEAIVRLADGVELTIAASGDGPGGAAVRRLTVDGTPTTRSWLRFADVAHGATLEFETTAVDEAWGAAPDDLPPSFPPP